MLQTTIRVGNASHVGTTGLDGTNIKFRRSPFGAGDVITIGGISGSIDGIYLADFIGVTHQAAQLWIDGVYQPTWGTKYIGDVHTYITTVLGDYIKKDGSVAFTGDESMGTHKLTNLLSTAPAGTDAINKDYADSRYLQLGEKVLFSAGNVLVVDYAATDLTGVRYNTIQEAIDYAAGTGAASPTNRWTIYVFPHKNTSSFTGYVENLTLKKYVDIIGLGGMVLVKGSVTVSGVWTGGTFARIKNMVFSIVDTSYLARGQEMHNCQFLVFEDVGAPTVATENSQFYDCGFWRRGSVVTTLITSTGDNVFIKCVANADVTGFIGSDKSIGFEMLDDVAAYYKIT